MTDTIKVNAAEMCLTAATPANFFRRRLYCQVNVPSVTQFCLIVRWMFTE
jgi:hypothetical protein